MLIIENASSIPSYFLQEVQGFKTIEELDAFILKHGENVIDLLGAQVDRIERKLKERHPDVRHVDLEVL